MKFWYGLVFFCLTTLFLPITSFAEVITNAELDQLTVQAQDQNNGCQFVNAITATQTGNPSWKTLSLANALSIKYPWSNTWLISGKQLPQMDSYGATMFSLGRFMVSEACVLQREYLVDVVRNQTIPKFYARQAREGLANGDILERFTINGHKAALVSQHNTCAQEAIAIEMPKSKALSLVIFTHRCGALNSELLRMAATLK